MYQVDPSQTKRAGAYSLWMNAPNPMVTFFKKLDVTPLLRFSRKTRLKFNMLLCWCIGLAAERVEEFYLLPVGKALLRYDTLAVNTIVKNREGEVSSCDVPMTDDLQTFNRDYLRLTREVAASCRDHDLLIPVEGFVTILGNLMENAIEELSHDHTASPDVIHASESPREIHIGIYCRPDVNIITCEDTGRGIQPELLDHIFEKGVSSKGENRGTGLFLVHELMEEYGGTIDIDTEPGEGTCFTLTFTRKETESNV